MIPIYIIILYITIITKILIDIQYIITAFISTRNFIPIPNCIVYILRSLFLLFLHLNGVKNTFEKWGNMSGCKHNITCGDNACMCQ